MRLIAALGMLVIAAITTGGLASLASKRPAPREQQQASPKPSAAPLELPTFFDPAGQIEAQVEAAEQAAGRARAMIRSERQRGLVDKRLLDELEQRVDKIDETDTIDSIHDVDATGAHASGTTNKNGTRERVPFASQPRPL